MRTLLRQGHAHACEGASWIDCRARGVTLLVTRWLGRGVRAGVTRAVTRLGYWGLLGDWGAISA